MDSVPRNELYFLAIFTTASVCHPIQEQVPVDPHCDSPLETLTMVLPREYHQESLAETHFVFKCIPRNLLLVSQQTLLRQAGK